MIIDAHGHLLDVAYRKRRPLNARLDGDTDVPLMRKGGVGGQLCATWTPDITLSGPHTHSVESPLGTLLAAITYVHRELAGASGKDILLVRSSADLSEADATGRIALVIGMEGTDALDGEIANLRQLHALGLRHVGLVHEHANEFGAASQVWEHGKMRHYDPDRDPECHLTDVGRSLIREMVQLGILIDLTHLVEPAFTEVINFIGRPVLIGHGGARGVTDSIRYLSDDQIRAVARSGGVVAASPTPLGPTDEQAGLPLLLDNIDHIARLVGVAHVGIGTDFKEQPPGYYAPGFVNIGETSAVASGLKARGYNASAIDQIMGENFRRIFQQTVG
jgi:membrane dipeptidase